ncbi:MAG: hypothetical protein JO250_09320 [Armatimonadetes bacterium]|nr:hypothetical protein [Armatimonadota bacterium]
MCYALQTFVQLNILFLAAPALAGWVLSSAAHPMLAQAARVVSQPAVRQAEATPQAIAERYAPPPAFQRPAVAPPLVIASDLPAVSPLPAAPAEPVATQFNPFPHAARAP